MNAQDVSDIFTARLRKLAQSGLPAHEVAANVQRLMEAERAQKLSSDKSQPDFMLPFFSGRKAHLSLV